MISDIVKPAVTRVITPAAKGLLRLGLTPNIVTILGSSGVVVSSFYFYVDSRFFLGSLVVSVFALSDLFDGTMARISEAGSSPWGGFLDSTLDRITDSSIIIALLIGLNKTQDRLIPVVLVALVTGMLVPYIRAKAESLDIECSGGLAERTERLTIALLFTGLHGLQVPYSLAIGMWLLAILGTVTVIQRILIVRSAAANL
ncbi:MAG: CDP-alcohol phosphatidyltransferase family protein [Actinobacteria bacterium]|nr:CDP-alcohol phosphatidyltransferase family protein [Actinomycetota bacterium]